VGNRHISALPTTGANLFDHFAHGLVELSSPAYPQAVFFLVIGWLGKKYGWFFG